jgi:hypothetical protein
MKGDAHVVSHIHTAAVSHMELTFQYPAGKKRFEPLGVVSHPKSTTKFRLAHRPAHLLRCHDSVLRPGIHRVFPARESPIGRVSRRSEQSWDSVSHLEHCKTLRRVDHAGQCWPLSVSRLSCESSLAITIDAG